MSVYLTHMSYKVNPSCDSIILDIKTRWLDSQIDLGIEPRKTILNYVSPFQAKSSKTKGISTF